MVVYANLCAWSAVPARRLVHVGRTDLLGGRLDGLFDEVDEVGRAQLAQCLQRLGASLNRRLELVLVDSGGSSASALGAESEGKWQQLARVQAAGTRDSGRGGEQVCGW